MDDLNLGRYLISKYQGERVNIVDALFAIGEAIDALARAIDRLGLNGAASPMGAIEVLSLEVKGLGDKIAEGLSSLAEVSAGPSRGQDQ